MWSTCSGSGYATANRILAQGLLKENPALGKNTPKLKDYIHKTLDVLDTAYRNNSKILLEGTQGTGLSLFHGNYPYVTSRDTSIAGCLSETGIAPSRVRKTIMVCRTYPIRVADLEGGASGPMVHSISRDEIAKRSLLLVKDIVENSSDTNKPRKTSEFDWDLLRKSVALNLPTDITLTFVDYLDAKNVNAYRYEQLTEKTKVFISDI